MLSRRALAIILVVAFALLLVLAGAIRPWIIPDIGDTSSHSWSGTVIGHRGMYDLILRLNKHAERNIASPNELFSGKRRVVLLDPNLARVESEHGHLEQMQSWIKGGGELVLVTMSLSGDFYKPGNDADSEDGANVEGDDTERKATEKNESASAETDTDESSLEEEDEPRLPWEQPTEKQVAKFLEENFGRFRLVERLGLRDLHIEPSFDDNSFVGMLDETTFSFVRQRTLMSRKPEVSGKIKATGSLAWAAEGIESIRLPKGKTPHFVGEDTDRASGSIMLQRGVLPFPIALEYSYGLGKVVIASEPALFNNFGLSEGDNAVLAYRLVAGNGELPVVFDEYYRMGHPAQGNTLSLMLAHPYWIALLALLITIGLWVWRQLARLGPPLPNPPADRRSVLEYVDTMANLFWRGGKHVFALNVLYDGLLEELRHDVHLPPGTGKEQILRSVEQRDPPAAMRLRSLMSDIAALGAGDTRLSSEVLRQFMERLNACKLPERSQQSNTKLRRSTIVR
jgi:hypothetical protein